MDFFLVFYTLFHVAIGSILVPIFRYHVGVLELDADSLKWWAAILVFIFWPVFLLISILVYFKREEE